jgi:hypothetical protein
MQRNERSADRIREGAGPAKLEPSLTTSIPFSFTGGILLLSEVDVPGEKVS